MSTEIQQAVLDAAHERNECAFCGRELQWTLPDEFNTRYGSDTNEDCTLEIAHHTLSGLMEVEQL